MASPKTTYTKEKSEQILTLLASGTTLVNACELNKTKVDTFLKWLKKGFDDLKERYEIAKESHAEMLNQAIDDMILAPLTPEEKEYPYAYKRRENFIKKKQWELEKRHRNVYGTQVTITQNHTIDLKPVLKDMMERRQKRLQAQKANETMKVVKSTETPLESPNTNLIAHSIIKPNKRS